jgi:predicted SnoaL-like aldol condensation-catalyzing enzyme
MGAEVAMTANPYDPLKRTDLSKREQILLRFTAEVLHGTNTALIDTLVAADYRQHTHGVGQGRDGIRKYIAEIASRRPGREQWRPVLLFEDQLAEHWDVVQPLPAADYDPMAPSKEDLQRFFALFGIAR